ncbi:hypothetical protein TTHERM_000753303 (macronuclear) [Tetrahymena thermophila SB210]|uniref:Uncharacterized protein n=1 Tax=Tetrahymena thermophila (strain SB210) TaxID=312017 RepID=W7XHH8_TETTS|nr:hypothetical protein TTHERM_000753303 [Tetrahymena thermophila SB210]EWS73816.1 hypothetical protein TTHERM_000753303 [Tetrahymena thermophila SB210]|eukprot:XP_012653639.1 hypothetical protein TTHERM_000753303 [Tetrahymena thermophila SB210]
MHVNIVEQVEKYLLLQKDLNNIENVALQRVQWNYISLSTYRPNLRKVWDITRNDMQFQNMVFKQ